MSGPDLASNINRRDTAVRALADEGIACTIYPFPGGVETWGADNALVSTIMADRPEALVCYDDVVALGVMDALRAQGLRVPGDIGIVGFDDIPFAAISNPRLTTVAQPIEEMACSAVTMLLTAIQQGELPPASRLPVRLIERETTGSAR